MVRKIMHRISDGPASQRDVCHQSLVSPNSVSATCPAVTGNFQTEVAPNDFQRIIDQFADAEVGGPSDVLLAFGLPRGSRLQSAGMQEWNRHRCVRMRLICV